MMKKHLFLTLLLSVFTLSSWAASSSVPEFVPTYGQDFWLTFMDNCGINNNYLVLRLHVVAKENSTVTITAADGTTLKTQSVSAGSSFTYEIKNSTNRAKVYATQSGVIENKGVHVTSTGDICVYSSSYYASGSTISYDASPVLQTGALGTEYVVQTYYADAAELAVVATEDATKVTITLAHDAVNAVGANFAAGAVIDTMLNAGQLFLLKGEVDDEDNTDLSGTTVLSDKAVAVFCGSIRTTIPWDNGADGDHIFEQALPVSSWGCKFIVPEMHGFPSTVSASEPTLYSLTAIYDNTQVRVSDGTTFTLFTLNRGETANEWYSNAISVAHNEAPKFIQTSQPVICYGYMTNGTANKNNDAKKKNVGEPSMVLIPSIRQSVQSAYFAKINESSATGTPYHYVAIIVPDWAKSAMELNGTAIPSSSFTTLSGSFKGDTTRYAYARLVFSDVADSLSNSLAPFLAYAYGVKVGSAESYAYATVFNTAPAAPVVKLGNLKKNDMRVVEHGHIEEFCNQHPGVDFVAEVDYPHDSIRWELGENTFSSSDTASHMYGRTISEGDTTHNVKFFVYRTRPLSGIQDIDSVCISLVVHPVYYDTLVQYVPASAGAYVWKHSSPHAFGRLTNPQIDFSPSSVDSLGRQPYFVYDNLDTVKTSEKRVLDSLYYKTQNYGCDSIFYLDLHVRPAETDTVCQEEGTYTWLGHNDATADPLKHKLFLNGAQITTIPTTLSGTVAETILVFDSMKNVLGTDSVEALMLTIEPTPTLSLTAPESQCYPTTSFTIAYAHTNATKLRYIVPGKVNSPVEEAVTAAHTFTINTTGWAAGDYTVKAVGVSEYDCVSDTAETTFTIKVQPKLSLTTPAAQCYPAGSFEVSYNHSHADKLFYTVAGKVTAPVEVSVDAAKKFTINTSGWAAGSYMVTAYPRSALDCEGDAKTTTLVINTKPSAGITSVESVCQNTASAEVQYTSADAATYWYRVKGTSLTGTASAAASGTFSLSTGALAVGEYTLQLVAKSATCESDTAEQIFNIWPLPTVTLTTADLNTCYPVSALNIDYTSTDAATISYTLTKNGESTPAKSGNNLTASATGTISIANPGTLTAGTYTLRVTAKSEHDCQILSAVTKTITIYDQPTVILSDIANVCLKTPSVPVSYTTTYADKYSYVLKNASNATVAEASNMAALASGSFDVPTASLSAGTYTLTVSVTSDHSCGSQEATKTFTIYLQPTLSLTAPEAQCYPTTSFTIAYAHTNATKLRYIVPGKVNSPVEEAVTAAHTFTINTTGWAAGDYTVKAVGVSEYDCVSDTAETTFTIKVQPKLSLTTPAAQCYPAGSFEVSYNHSHADKLFYTVAGKVTAPVEVSVDAAKKFTINTSGWAAGTYTVTAYPRSALDCDGEPKTTTLVINTKPSAGITSVESVCQNTASAEVQYTSADATTYWYKVKGTSLTGTASAAASGSFSLSTGALAVGEYTLQLVAKSATCESDTAELIFNIWPIPVLALPAQTAQCFPIASFPISFTHTDATKLVYTVDGRITTPVEVAVTASSTSFSINTNTWPAGTYTLHVTPISANGCEGAEKSVSFAINAQPTLTLDPIGNICFDEPNVTVTYSQTGASTYSYKLTKGAAVIVPETTPAPVTGSFDLNTSSLSKGQYTLTLTVQSANDCGSEKRTTNFEVFAKPALSNLTITDPNKCYPYKQKIVVGYTNASGDTKADNYEFQVVNKVTHASVSGLSGTMSTMSGSFRLNLDKVDLPAGQYEVQVIPTATHGAVVCTGDTVRTNLTIYPQPTVTLDPIDDLCETQDVLHAQFKTTDAKKAKIIVHDHNNRIADQTRNINSLANNVYIPLEIGVYSGTPRIPAGTYTIKIVAESDKGCVSDTASQTFTIEKQPKVTALSLTTPVCRKNDVTATYRTSDAVTCEYTLDGGAPVPVAVANTANKTFTIATTALAPGEHTVVLQAKSATCVSAPVTKTFVVNQSYEIPVPETKCLSSMPYEWHGKLIDEPIGGPYIYYDSLKTACCNCDSVYVLQLTVTAPADTIVTDTTICSGDYFDWVIDVPCVGKDTLMRRLSSACEQLYTLPACAPGCATCNDDCRPVYQLKLHVLPEVPVQEETRALCEGSSFLWHGQTIALPGIYEVVADSVVGTGASKKCNVTYRLIVTSLVPDTLETSDHACEGADYTFFGHTYTNLAAGHHTYADTLRSVGGCDSVYRVLHLTVGQPIEMHETKEACDTYIWRGHAYATSGTYYDTYGSSLGCDSTYVLHLTIHRSYAFEETYYYTQGQLPVTLHEYTFASFGDYTRSFITASGCDSVYTLHIVELPSVRPTKTTNATICKGETCTWRGHAYTDAGIYTELTPDTLYELHLAVNVPVITDTVAHACGSFSWHGNIYTTSGTYQYPATPAACDAITRLHLTIGAANTGSVATTACRGEQVSLGGRTFVADANTSFTNVLRNASGCDSTVTYTLTVLAPEYAAPENRTICQGDSTLWNGVYYKLPGTYEYRVAGAAANGCEKVYTLHLTMNRSYLFEEDVEVSPESLPYVWTGHTRFGADTLLNDNGDYYDRFTTLSGCDSVYHIHFHISDPWVDRSDTSAVTACDSYKWPKNNKTYTVSGLYSDTVWSNAAHTDYQKVRFLNLTINHTVYQTVEDMYVCDNDYLSWFCPGSGPAVLTHDTTLTTTRPGAGDACDTVVTARVHVSQSKFYEEEVTVCQNELPYSWRGRLIQAAGFYYDSLVSPLSGCDSIFSLQLHVTTVTAPTEDAPVTMCHLDTLEWEGFVIANPEVGNHLYYKYFTLPGECDSTYKTIKVTVEEVLPVDTLVEVCYGQEVKWRTAGGVKRFTALHDTTMLDTLRVPGLGCDKVHRLKLTVSAQPLEETDPAQHLCVGDSYTWPRNGQVYATAGTYEHHVPFLGTTCDSVIYKLTITKSDTTMKRLPEAAICRGGEHTFLGVTYHPLNDTLFADTVKSLLHPLCDSLITTQRLTVAVPDTFRTTPAAACGEYIWAENGQTYTNKWTTTGGAPRTFLDTVRVAATGTDDCPETYTLEVMVNPTYAIDTFAVIKPSQSASYTWHSIPCTQGTGDYVDPNLTAAGCDSVWTLHLTVSPKAPLTKDTTICLGDTVNWRGQKCFEPLQYQDDSDPDTLYLLNVKVNPVYSKTLNKKECGTVYTWHGVDYTTSDSYTWDMVSICGCDSVETLVLTIGEPVLNTLPDVTICRSELPYLWQGGTYPVQGADTILTKVFAGVTAAGCDSTVTMSLHILPTFETHLYDTICSNQSVMFGGVARTAAGIYRDTVPSLQNSCDSVLVLHLETKQAYIFPEENYTSVHVPYNWHGLSISVPGLYHDSYTAVNGCDSVYSLRFKLNDPVEKETTVNECGSYTWPQNGRTYDASGTYKDSTWNALHTDYDTIYTLHLTIRPQYAIDSVLHTTICEGDSLEWFGTYYKQATTQHLAFQTALGCDSMKADLVLTVLQKARKTLNETVCQNHLPYIFNGRQLRADTTIVDTLSGQAANGCDSIVTLRLHITPTEAPVITDTTICAASTFVWNGETFKNMPVGDYFRRKEVSLGSCGSKWDTLFLHVADVTPTLVYDTVCYDGDYLWNGTKRFEHLTLSFVYPDTVEVPGADCNEVYELHLTVRDQILPTVLPDTALCAGQSFDWFGQHIVATGDYHHLLQTAAGCDSLLTRHVTVAEITPHANTRAICLGDSVELPWQLGTFVHPVADTTYRDTVAPAVPGDCPTDVNILTVKVTTPFFHEQWKTMCDSYYWSVTDSTYTESTDETVVFTSALTGCDSTYVLHLTIGHTVDTNEPAVVVLPNQLPYTWHHTTFNDATPGDYTAVDSLQTAVGGCDSVVHFTLTVSPFIPDTTRDSFCAGDTYDWTIAGETHSYQHGGTHSFTDATGQPHLLYLTENHSFREVLTDTACYTPYVWSRPIAGDTVILASGTYYDRGLTVSGCDSVYVLRLTMGLPQLITLPDTTICRADLASFSWFGNHYDIQATDTTLTKLFKTQQAHCDSVVQRTLHILPLIPETHQYDTICKGESFTWTEGNGQTYTDGGEYRHTLSSAVTGCDSVLVLHLLANPTYSFWQNVNVPELDLPFHWNRPYSGDTLLYTNGTYYDYGHTALGCDSTYSVNFLVGEPVRDTLSKEACSEFFWCDSLYTESGVYRDTAWGATRDMKDTIYMLNLTVYSQPALDSLFMQTICEGDTIEWFGQQYWTTTHLTLPTIKTAHGCDSLTATLQLVVLPTLRTTEQATICQGRTYWFNGRPYTEAGSYSDTLSSLVTGCDSISTLDLTVTPVTHDTSRVTMCSTAHYRWGGMLLENLKPDSIYTFVSLPYDACGSDSTLLLKVIAPDDTIPTIATICYGESYTWTITNPFTHQPQMLMENLTTTQTQFVLFEDPADTLLCGVIYRLDLTVLPEVLPRDSAITLCADESIIWRGQTIDHAGLFTAIGAGEAAGGCDSIFTLTVTMPAITTHSATSTICPGEPVPFGGVTYYPLQDTVLVDTLAPVAPAVCPTEVNKLTVKVVVPFFDEKSKQACESYYWSVTDSTYTESTDETAVFTSALTGCDSTYVLHLTINKSYSFNESRVVTPDSIAYTWHGYTFKDKTPGVYTVDKKFLTQAGCDSVYHLTLTVSPFVPDTTRAAICEGDSYSWTISGQSYTPQQTGTSMYSFTDATDHPHLLYLTVYPTYTKDTTATVCAASYLWHGKTLTTSGTYYDSLQTAQGCDSVFTLHLTIGAPQATTLRDTTCHGTLYEWLGQSLLADTLMPDFSFTRTFRTAAGCDSVVTMEVHVLPTYETHLYATICSNETYPWYGGSYNTTGEYRATLDAASGCDSVLVLHLQVNDIFFSEENVSVHEQTLPYQWHGHLGDTLLYTTGDYYDRGTTAAGCDSTYLLRFHVGFAERDTVEAEACGSYFWRDSLYTTSGLHRDTVWDATHTDYDTIHALQLTIYPEYQLDSMLTVTICEGDTIEWFGQQYWSTTTDTRVLKSMHLCDSLTASLNLTVLPTLRETEMATICEGETYEFRGRLYRTNTTVSDTLSSLVTGCDSIITLNLTVTPVMHDTSRVTMCATAHYYWDAFMHENLQADSTYTFVSLPYDACGSDSTLLLTVIAPDDTILTTATICQGERYTWTVTNPFTHQQQKLMQNLTTTQTQFVDLEDAADTLLCGAFYRLDLTVLPSYRIDTSVTICTGDSYLWGGLQLTADTTVFDTLQTLEGCDSIVTLHLHVTPPRVTYDTAYLCPKSTFTFAGHVLDSAGVYRDTVTNGVCIETIHELLLLHADTTVHVDAQQVCADEYIWNGKRYTETGIYRDTLTSVVTGCDSVVDLRLYLLKTRVVEETKHVTDRQLPYTWYDYTYTAAGDYHEAVASKVTACDSILYTLHLFVDPVIIEQTYEVDTLCAGATYTWAVTGETYATSLDTAVLVSDTVHNLSLTILPDYRRTEYVTICDTELPYIWNGMMIMQAGSWQRNFTSASGCDSTQYLELTVGRTYAVTRTDTICEGETYVLGSQLLTGTGVYTETFTTTTGCDSTVTVELYVHQTPATERFDTVCGFLDWEGQRYSASGDYRRILTGQYGCDSVVTLHLQVMPQYADTADVEVYEQALPYIWSGHKGDTTLLTNGIYYDSLQTVQGCDSVFTLHFHIGFVQRDTITERACDTYTWYANDSTYTQSANERDTVWLPGHTDFSAVHYLYLTICGEAEQVTAPDVHLCAGDAVEINGTLYAPKADSTVVDNLHTFAGCDSVVTTHIFVHEPFFLHEEATICSDSSMYWHGMVLTLESIYTDSLIGTYGCDSVYELKLNVLPVFHDTVAPIFMCTNDVLDWGGYHFEDRDTGSFVYHSVRYDECGSDSVLYLRVDQSFDSLLIDSVSDSEAYGMWRTIDIPQLPVPTDKPYYLFYDSLTTAAGCDSVFTLQLVVGPTYLFHDTVDLCQNDSLWWHDTIRYAGNLADPVEGLAPGVEVKDTVVFKTIPFGYDSVYTLVLTVRPIFDTAWTETICPTDSIEFCGRWVHEVGQYDTTLTTIYGCDSLCHLTLLHFDQFEYAVDTTVCYATSFYWESKDSTYFYEKGGVYTDTAHLYTVHGCDSIIHLNLTVENLTVEDTIVYACLDDTIHWPHRFTTDTLILQAGDSIGEFLFIDTVTSPLGCVYYDSVWINVVRPVTMISASAGQFCADDGVLEINYELDLLGGTPREYYIYFSDSAKAQGFQDQEKQPVTTALGLISVPTLFSKTDFPRPDTYEATLYLNNGGGICRDTATMSHITFRFDVLYPAWFAEQHWNNTMAVISPEYNASVMQPQGYTFTAYQWYLNGAPIDGADESILSYLHDIPNLDPHDPLYNMPIEYQVALTRADDGKTILSCPIVPQAVNDPAMPEDFYFTLQPTYVDHGSPFTQIISNTTGVYTVFDAAGRRISTGEIGRGESCVHGVTEIELPYIQGTYLVRMESDAPNPYTGKVLIRTVKVLVK